MTLTKPGIVRMCLVTTLGGLWLAPDPADGSVTWWTWGAALLGTALIVAAANALNMIWEGESDKLMPRTRNRPVASGRLDTGTAMNFSVVLGALACLVLAVGANAFTAVLGAFALMGYVFVYTPLKRVSPLALVVGAVPGAAPPLLGWTAVTGQLDAGGLVLFGILMAWQMPHFLAIALYRNDEYQRAGIRTVVAVRGERAAKWQAVAWSVALVAVSVLLTPIGVAGEVYFYAALAIGVGFLGWSITGLRAEAGIPWARRFFFASLLYLPLVIVALVVDVLVLGALT